MCRNAYNEHESKTFLSIGGWNNLDRYVRGLYLTLQKQDLPAALFGMTEIVSRQLL